MRDAMIRRTHADDLPAWRQVARQVEPLFGPMADDPGFLQAIAACVDAGNAWTALDAQGRPVGFVAVDPRANDITWLAVVSTHRGCGLGAELVRAALDALDGSRPVTVETFAPGVPHGAGARALYLGFGFTDTDAVSRNPAGIATVIMRRSVAGEG